MSTKGIQEEILGDYLILKELGEGMLGKVLLVQHRFLKQFFVLKLFPDELSQNRGFVQRFEKEVQMLATLDHPNIVKMRNVCCVGQTYFLVCDAVVDKNGNATNLAQYLEGGGVLSEEEIYSIASQVASALDHAHQKSFGDEPLAHRALKLNNILLDVSQESLGVQVADFGLSRIVGIGAVLAKTYRELWERFSLKAGSEDVQKLHDSFYQYFGFLAPEQKGKGESTRDADARADVYSFGVLLYFLLVGRFPEGVFPMPSECNLGLQQQSRELKKLTQDLHSLLQAQPTTNLCRHIVHIAVPAIIGIGTWYYLNNL